MARENQGKMERIQPKALLEWVGNMVEAWWTYGAAHTSIVPTELIIMEEVYGCWAVSKKALKDRNIFLSCSILLLVQKEELLSRKKYTSSLSLAHSLIG